jgi:hypothetical protein
MSETADVDHRGRFLPGNKRSTGRPKGARDKHTRNFLDAMSNDFEAHGAEVIRKVREEQPAVWLKIAFDMLPKQAEIDVSVDIMADVSTTLEAFRTLTALVGADPRERQAGMRKLRQLAPQLEYEPGQ